MTIEQRTSGGVTILESTTSRILPYRSPSRGTVLGATRSFNVL